ncbi:bifunctional aldolase/short-chain dehydrogenase [Shewanella eurypsychrophilus]|uniref:Bifunctional aldolase/short-chain dehydrogenase n=1 Tax=Shewanella eurypsychrophilus TaxID=2593656 RepID=A0ABX6V9G8_9GAMM|nr:MULTISPECIES: bifunctional aldolase/short-chain dehydrogenase [Shewanella]QFU24107.1 bifunctional aldolase/short-chain dehydrogenase [Shewanella sp. YLB-09]QPG59315.1 bifunctional aldolase/short-chain dehydrogenase [Shewanella eurypsychrophilus]
MQSLWHEHTANQFTTPLELRVYSSRLLGQEPALVLHGGGNTSVKTQVNNLFGEAEEILFVKGSGWDLETIEAAGFAPVKMDVLLSMAKLPELNDSDMVKYQRAAMIDPNAPNPSVEAILHAIIPFAFVDHTHADAIVTLTNTGSSSGSQGAANILQLFGKRVLVIPYVMPGFALAKQIYEMTQDIDWATIEGLVLMNHGLFTFSDDAKTAYENTIKLVTEAEAFIEASLCITAEAREEADEKPLEYCDDEINIDLIELAQIRKLVSAQKGSAQVALLNSSKGSCHIASHPMLHSIASRGPLTPDHVIRTKRIPAILNDDFDTELGHYAREYIEYFDRYQSGQTMLNYAPNFAIWQGKAAISFGKTVDQALIIEDITSHTFDAILTAEALGGYQALSPADIFAVEYWELEQAKLKKAASVSHKPLQGKIAMVTCAATPVGQAVVSHMEALGANVVELGEHLEFDNLDKCQEAAETAIIDYGGLDIVCCLGDDPSNLMLLRACEPFLAHGINPTVLCVNHGALPVMNHDSIKVLHLNCSSSQILVSADGTKLLVRKTNGEYPQTGIFNLLSAITMMLSSEYVPHEEGVTV